jgi:protein-tyrosine-phosphatase
VGEMTAKTDEQKRIEKLEQSLRIISTWAVCDPWSQEPRDKAMRDIRDKCDLALK